MTNHAEVSLESDDLDRDLEKEAPPPPVMVVQYKKRGIPSWIGFPLILSVPVISIMVYHRLVVEPYRARAAEAERVLEALSSAPKTGTPSPVQGSIAGAKAGSGPVATGPSVADVAKGQSVAGAAPLAPPNSSPAAPPSSPLPGTTASSTSAAQASPTPGPPSSPTAGVAANPAASIASDPSARPSRPETGSPATTGAGPASPEKRVASAAGGQKVDPRAGQATPKPQSGGPAVAALEAVQPPAFPPSDSSSSDATKDRSPDATAPRPTGGVHTRGLGPLAAGPIDPPTEKERQNGADGLRPQGEGTRAVHGLPPLPTKEENDRAFKEEAARKGAEIADSRNNREAEIRSLRYEERVKFRQELREILKTHGTDAADEIDRLSRRNGYESTSDDYTWADRIWRFGRMSQPAKVKMIRSHDLPESVILDFLSDNQNTNVGTRNGPRNKKEVRIRAARQLLAYELPPLSEMPPPTPSGGQTSSPLRTKASAPPVARRGPPR